MQMLLKDGKSKVLTLSYDDGVIQDKRLVEILDKNGIKCTFNINTGFYAPEGTEEKHRMSKKLIVELLKNSPHEVAVHAYTHPSLPDLDSSEVIYEIIEDRKNIEKDFGVIARGMAYPYGTYNDRVIDIIDKCGICYARTVNSTLRFCIPENWLELHPTCHHKNDKLMELSERFVKEPTESLRAEMFYLWGHSYEFDDDDNWEVIEKFAKFIGNRDNIWYATNIEIYDYVKAYKNLKTSYDKKIVYNPSDIDVWFAVGFDRYCVKSGETLVIRSGE